jgi:glycosyltransferase involved in cell wall biosynthesis
MDRWVSQRVFRIADVVQVWDESTKRELSKYLGVDRKKMIAVPHGNYLPLYPPEKTPSKFEARRELGLPRDDRILLYFGMIRPYKQVPRLLDIWNEVDPENAHLMIAGNPKYDDLAEAIKTRASRRDDVTTDLRYIPENEVPTYFAACDVAVFPYKDIFSSGSVVLAMSMGRAFVAPATGAIPSLDPGKNIVYDSLHTGIKASLNIGTAELNRAGRINIQIARFNLSWESICTSFASLYCCDPKSESVDGSSCKRQS